MSAFGGFTGFGGNNSNNNNNQQQQGTGFGGFGGNNQQTGFGSSGGFGSTNTNTGGGLFGNTSGGFGSGGGGFGSNAPATGFGAPKPAFGTATTSAGGGGLFGSSTQATGGFGGGFGTNNANNTSGGFGASTGGGLFGQNKPAFGSTTNTGGSLFGGNTAGGFGSTTQNPTSGFGSTSTTGGFGASAQSQNTGTSSVPFEAHREKEGVSTSLFQAITMQQPYQQYSFEELRLADYQQGKRFGNSNGQPGAFGQSSGFGGFNSNAGTGGFGSTNNNNNNNNSTGGLFGNSNQQGTTGGFGQQSTGTSFGGGGGNLFGSKPATGGLFGGTPASSAQSTTGLFGSTAGTGFGSGGGGFGANNNSNNNTNTLSGGTLFGGSQPSKPAFGGFGSATSTATTGFGQTATSSGGGGIFGSGGSTSFGQNTGTAFGGGFGNNNQQTQPQTQNSGSLFGGGGFGANNQQQKPGSLFGSTQPATGTSLFGNQNNQQGSGSLFGGANNNQQQQTGSLFGPKPAGTSTGLFGAAPANTGTGLFGNTAQQNQPAGGGLFGTSANNQQQKPGLFGLNTSTNNNPGTGTGLFGQSSNTQTLGGSLFGGGQQNQQPQSNSLFGSQSQPQPQQAPQLTASLIGSNPYGNDQLFASLGTSTPSPGPIATPLSGGSKSRKPAILPQHKINPLAASRLLTPQKRGGGYGFSYSTYGTPGSAIGTPTGMNGLLASGSLGRSLGKSFSASNLRNVYNAESSNLAPGLFSPGRSPYNNNNSVKRLSINRNLDTRRSLFSEDDDSTPRKRVLFEEQTPNGDSASSATLNGTTGALVRTEDQSPESTTVGSPETNGHVNGNSHSNGALVSVPEEDQTTPSTSSRPDAAKEHARRMQTDQEPGQYWSRPPLKDLQNKSRGELKRVHLVVGREGCGQIDFGVVDLTNVPLDQLFGHLIFIEMRKATVYDESKGVKTPPRGKELNVPSLITLDNSWPRKNLGREPIYSKTGPAVDKHIARLKRVAGTEFVSYNASTGQWTFRVQHYTTYGLDYDEDENEDTMMSGALIREDDEATEDVTPESNVFATAEASIPDDDASGGFESSPDDTFHFKQGLPRKHVPGNFDDEDAIEYDDEMEEIEDANNETRQSFLGLGSVGPLVVRDEDDMDDFAPEDREEMAGTFPVQPTEPDPMEDSPIRPKSILKNSQFGRSKLDTPSKNRVVLESNWTEQLQRTASPRKQNRQALRESQATVLKPQVETAAPSKPLAAPKPFTTSIDIMNSLFGRKEKAVAPLQKQSVGGKGFEWPYAKRPKTSDAFKEMNEQDKEFHMSHKPSWGPDGRLVYAVPSSAGKLSKGVMVNVDDSIVGEHVDIRFAKFVLPESLVPRTMDIQKCCTEINLGPEGTPHAAAKSYTPFALYADAVDASTAAGQQEKSIWRLASILFDSIDPAEMTKGLAEDEKNAYVDRNRKEKLSEFWRELVRTEAEASVFHTRYSDEKAVHLAAAGDIPAACSELLLAGDFKLATMFAQAPGSDSKFRERMRKQIMHWDQLNELSEMSIPTRALYELLAGNVGEVAGKGGPKENRCEAFNISQHFNLGWRRAFGLRLWYETQAADTIEDAVLAYQTALDDDKETIKPVPSFVTHAEEEDEREDVLWGLLQLYAAQKSPDIHAPIGSILATENFSENPIDARLSWQLLLLLRAKDIRGTASADDDDIDGDSEKENREAETLGSSRQSSKALDLASDVLTLQYASALKSALPSASPEQQPDLLLTALYVLLHLSGDQACHAAVDDLLYQTAPLLSSGETSPLTLPGDRRFPAVNGSNIAAVLKPVTLFDAITSEDSLKIPHQWLAAAQALWARAVDEDPFAEARYLLEAGRSNAAHDVLLHEIGPACIVRRSYDALREVLGGFEGGNGVRGWKAGGGVYFDFVHLLDMENMRDAGKTKERRETLKRLIDGLVALGQNMGKDASANERAALWEMGRVVADQASHDKGVDKAKMLGLPLTEDAYLKHTRELSLGYYRALMVGEH